jgi:hypothetical protein
LPPAATTWGLTMGELSRQSYPPPEEPRYMLRREGGKWVIQLEQVVGRFQTREEARQYMLDTTEQRKRALARVK